MLYGTTASEMDAPPIYRLPQDTLHQIFSALPLRQIMICRSVCKLFNQNQWLRFNLDFLPFRSLHPVASSLGLVYLWGDSPDLSPGLSKSLLVCNPLTRQFRVLPQLGSAWSRHGSVLVDSASRVMVLTELAALYCFSGSNQWLSFSSNLPSKPRSPILVSDSVYALCDVGSPWRSQWKLFSCTIAKMKNSQTWNRLERHEWGDVFDILKRPRLVRGNGNRILMVGGLKSSFSLNSSCSTILILRLDLESLDWDEAGRMPLDMFRCFQESSKFKVFGGGDRVCFSAKRVGRLALWDYCSGKGDWRWIDGVPGSGDGLSRGFVFEARLTALSP
uniref:SKP1-interacting partner 15 n=1 Tax=Cannabis sativa TaxID=3483 RepID=A0A803NJ17_CANSA